MQFVSQNKRSACKSTRLGPIGSRICAVWILQFYQASGIGINVSLPTSVFRLYRRVRHSQPIFSYRHIKEVKNVKIRV